MDRNAVTVLLQWMHGAGLNGLIRLRTDGEPAIQAVAAEIAARRSPAETLVEITPRSLSSSLGACGRFSETIAGLVRTLQLALEKRWNTTVAAVDPVFPFLVQYATFVYNRCHVCSAGMTPFEQAQKRSYNSALLPFGTAVLVRRADALRWPELEARWLAGLWMGRKAESDEHVATAGGLIAGRSCRVLTLQQVSCSSWCAT